jgi:hypothetical protein
MALLNAAGQPVAMQPHTFQIDIPAEAAASMSIDWLKIIPAVLSLIAAFASGNPATIMAAIVAFFNAITGK